MPEIKMRFQFEPDKDARQDWLGTRKRPFSGGALDLKGFYQTVDYDKDTRWVMIALFIELIAIALTIYGGGTKGGFWLPGSIITVIVFVFFDYIGSILYHSQKAQKCFFKNKFLIANDASEQAVIQSDLKKLDNHWKTILGVIFIVISAILKIGAILLLGKFKITFYIVFFLFYLIVIYIHLNHTGYFIAEWSVNNEFGKQFDQFIAGTRPGPINSGIIHSARKLNSPIKSEIKLNVGNNVLGGKITVGAHSLTFREETKEDDKTIYYYDLETIGILLDSDINLFINGQDTNQATIISRNILKHQIDRIH